MKAALNMILVLICTVCYAWPAAAQSSSLFVTGAAAAPVPASGPRGDTAGLLDDELSPAIADVSLTAIRVAPPRVFQLHDLVTIVVTESTQADTSASLDTEKKVSVDGEVTDFVNLDLAKLLRLTFEPTNAAGGGDPTVGVDFSNKFEGDGTYKRKDSMTARITAEVVDIKPNGNLVLEARKYIRNDKESLALTVTGVCQPIDVTAGNTVLSTQLFDLRVDSKHSGEVRRATKKGLITKLFDLIFNF